jgi:hypothetical protein
MSNWFKRRAREGSTWAGLAAAIFGIGEIAKVKEAGAIAEAVGKAGEVMVSGGDWKVGVTVGIGGLIAALLPDRDDRNDR